MIAQGKFKSLKTTEKGTELNFVFVSGTKDEVISRFQKAVGQLITLNFRPAQMELDDMDDDHEGITYSVDHSGVATVNPDQTSIEDYIETPEADEESVGSDEKQSQEEPTENIEEQSEDALPELEEQPDIEPNEIPLSDEQDGPGF